MWAGRKRDSRFETLLNRMEEILLTVIRVLTRAARWYTRRWGTPLTQGYIELSGRRGAPWQVAVACTGSARVPGPPVPLTCTPSFFIRVRGPRGTPDGCYCEYQFTPVDTSESHKQIFVRCTRYEFLSRCGISAPRNRRNRPPNIWRICAYCPQPIGMKHAKPVVVSPSKLEPRLMILWWCCMDALPRKLA